MTESQNFDEMFQFSELLKSCAVATPLFIKLFSVPGHLTLNLQSAIICSFLISLEKRELSFSSVFYVSYLKW